jgi:hypothetical protein
MLTRSALVSTLCIVAFASTTRSAFADCPGPFLRDMKRAYESAKKADAAGKKDDALFFYHNAEGSVCEGANPYEADAAKRAAPLGLELGAAAEKRGELDKARELYEAGGHLAAADRVFMQAIRAKPYEPGSYTSAMGHFNTRTQAWFLENNAVAIKAAGPYTPDQKYLAELQAMPAKGIEYAYKQEAANFNEDYLRDFVQLMQSRPDDASEPGALQRLVSAQQAFVQKWKRDDYLKQSRSSLDTLRTWVVTLEHENKALSDSVAAKVAQISEQHATTLRQKYFGAPELLKEAMDYYYLPVSDNSLVESKIASVRAQALKLGDEANAKNRYELAGSYYDVADADDKANAVRERGQQVAMKRMQPSIDQARKQQEELARQFGDPAKVAQMKRQAKEMRKALQAQQMDSPASNK